MATMTTKGKGKAPAADESVFRALHLLCGVSSMEPTNSMTANAREETASFVGNVG